MELLELLIKSAKSGISYMFFQFNHVEGDEAVGYFVVFLLIMGLIGFLGYSLIEMIKYILDFFHKSFASVLEVFRAKPLAQEKIDYNKIKSCIDYDRINSIIKTEINNLNTKNKETTDFL